MLKFQVLCIGHDFGMIERKTYKYQKQKKSCLRSVIFAFPHVDERPAGIEDTFLLCPAPVVKEAGK